MHHDPFGPSPEERAADVLEGFELNEVAATRFLRLQHQHRAGLLAGRLTFGFGGFRRVHRRLAYRSGDVRQGRYIVLRGATGRVVRLPFA